MIVYYLTSLSVFAFAMLAQYSNSATTEIETKIKKRPSTKFFLAMVVLTLTFVAGLRYYVGADYGAYYLALDNYASKLLPTLKELNEPGFPALAAITKLFTTEGAVFIFITSAFTMISILAITFKYTDTYVFSSLLFMFRFLPGR